MVAYYLLFIVASLCKKYQKAKASVETMNSAVKELTKSIGNNHWISEWKKLEDVARMKRGEALMIYNVSYTPGKYLTLIVIPHHPHVINSSIKGQNTSSSHDRWQKRQACPMVDGRFGPRS